MVSLFVTSFQPTAEFLERSWSLVLAQYPFDLHQLHDSLPSVQARHRLPYPPHKICHDLYLNDKANFYRIINLDGRLDAADQYITTDIARFCETLAALYSNVSKPVLDLMIFNYALSDLLVLWVYSDSPPTISSTGWILRQVTPAFGKLAAIEAKLEGDFRSAHSRLITNAEEIAFYNGASIEAGILNRAYIRLVRHINSIFKIRVAFNMTETLSSSTHGPPPVMLSSLHLSSSARRSLPPRPSIQLHLLPRPRQSTAQSHPRPSPTSRTDDCSCRLPMQEVVSCTVTWSSPSSLVSPVVFTLSSRPCISSTTSNYQSIPRPADLPADQPFYDLGHIEGKVNAGADVSLSTKFPL